MTPEPPELHFAYAQTPPSLDSFDVKAIHPDELAGRPGAFAVIGESHYVGVPTLDFHEVCSCEPLSDERVRTVALAPGVERTLSFATDRLGAETVAAVRSLDAFPGDADADVAHRFGPGAWTTLEIGDAAYETYHTYPEYDVALYTETTLEPRSATTARDRAGDPAGDDANPITTTHPNDD